MASVSPSATLLRVQLPLKQSTEINQLTRGSSSSSLKFFSVRVARSGFHVLRNSNLCVSCAAKPETVERVCNIVRKQMALSPEVELTPESTFAAIGADSLDTVEIVMSLEEEFGINVEDESSQNITTVQDAADLIETLVEKRSQA